MQLFLHGLQPLRQHGDDLVEVAHDAEGHKGDAADDFACAFHCVSEKFLMVSVGVF